MQATDDRPAAPSRLPELVPWLMAVVMSAVVLGPIATSLGEHFVGAEHVDAYGTQWFFWFTARGVLEGESLGHTDLFFHPWGKDIQAHTGTNVLDALFAVPFRALLGPVLGYNVFVLTALVAGAAAFGAFAREVTGDRLTAASSAVLFLFTPFVAAELSEGRPTQAILLFPVLFTWALWRSGTRVGWLAPVAAGVALALSGYQYWYYAFFGGLVALAHGLWRTAWPEPEAGPRVQIFARHVLIAIVGVLLCLPVGLSLLQGTQGEDAEVPGLLDVSEWTMSSTPPITREDQYVAMYVWVPLRDAMGTYHVSETDSEDEEIHELPSQVPHAVIPLLLLWLWRPGKAHRGVILAMIAAAGLIAMGPLLVAGDFVAVNPVYFAAVRSLGFLQRLWWPGRAVAFVVIVVHLAAARGLAAVSERWGTSYGAAAAALIGVLAVVELHTTFELVPYPTWSARIPSGYLCLAEADQGAVIEMPYAYTQAHLYYQTVHGLPIFGGMLEDNEVFTPPELTEIREKNAMITFLTDLTGEGNVDALPTQADLDELRGLGYRWLVLQKDAYVLPGGRFQPGLADNIKRTRERETVRLLADVLGRPFYEDGRIEVYAPWGDPSPCRDLPPEPDPEPVARAKPRHQARAITLRRNGRVLD